MTRVNATYDGEVLRPDDPLPLAPNTRVVVTVETSEEAAETLEKPNGSGEPGSFIRTALSLGSGGEPNGAGTADTSECSGAEEAEGTCEKGGVEPYAFIKTALAAKLDGPPDWSERLDYYLYGVDRDA